MGKKDSKTDINADNTWNKQLAAVFDEILEGSNIKSDFENLLDRVLREYLASYVVIKVGNDIDTEGWIKMALGHHKQFDFKTILSQSYEAASESATLTFDEDNWKTQMSSHRTSIKRRLNIFRKKISVTYLPIFSLFLAIKFIVYRIPGMFIRWKIHCRKVIKLK